MSDDKWGDWASGPEQSESSEPPEGSESSKRSKQGEQSDSSESLRKPDNVKQEWDGVYMYLPSNDEDEIVERINTEYERLRYECSQEAGVSIEKDRHFKPVLVLDGLEALEGMDGSEFLSRVEGLEFR